MASSAAGAASKAAKIVRQAAVKVEKQVKQVTKVAKEVSDEPKKPNGFLRTQPVSAACRKFFGHAEMSRADAMKQLWGYIRSHNLQDPDKRRNILCDEKLKGFLNCKERIDMTEIPGLLSPHFIKKAT